MKNVLRVKCLLVGESTVGKSALAKMFVSNGRNFPKNYLMTRGIEICSKIVTIADSDDAVVDVTSEFFLFDSSGKEVYVEVLLKYWETPDLIAVVFDVTDEASLNLCEKWIKLAQPLFTNNGLKGILIANKIDQVDQRVVSYEAGEKFAQKYGLQYFECSAKEAKGIEEPFAHLAELWLKIVQEKKITSSLAD